LGDGFGGFRLGAIVDGDVGTGSSKGQGDGFTEPAACAGD
jgi:hypothetical protein